MTRFQQWDKLNRHHNREAFSGGHPRGPILPMEKPSFLERLLGRGK